MSDILNLTNWSLLKLNDYAGEYIALSGIVDNHPRLGSNIRISHTSDILSVEYINDDLICHTRNSIYRCSKKYMQTDNICITSLSNSKTEIAELYNWYCKLCIYLSRKLKSKAIQIEPSLKRIRLKAQEKEQFNSVIELLAIGKKELVAKLIEYENKLIEEASKYNDCIFMDVTSIGSGSKLAFNINGNTGILNPKLHVGNFRDSIIYGVYDKDKEYIDFRYFVDIMGMSPYSWSENIKTLIVHNSKGRDVFIYGNVIHANETKKFSREEIFKYT
ncbi:MAG: hypothetical protein J6A59_12360 [Lachnospiraceae bacterium]|nr:hypothetical protein [Lachnospiraceae bacterium]